MRIVNICLIGLICCQSCNRSRNIEDTILPLKSIVFLLNKEGAPSFEILLKSKSDQSLSVFIGDSIQKSYILFLEDSLIIDQLWPEENQSIGINEFYSELNFDESNSFYHFLSLLNSEFLNDGELRMLSVDATNISFCYESFSIVYLEHVSTSDIVYDRIENNWYILKSRTKGCELP